MNYYYNYVVAQLLGLNDVIIDYFNYEILLLFLVNYVVTLLLNPYVVIIDYINTSYEVFKI